MSNYRVYVENHNYLIENMFLGEGWIIKSDPTDADLICLDGGSDVTPSIYNEETDPRTGHTSMKKDLHTLGLIKLAEMMGIGLVAICRGHQMLAVSYGFKLIQHIDNHAFSDSREIIILEHGKEYSMPASSAHHQAVDLPFNLGSYHNPDLYDAEDGTCEGIWHDFNVLGVQPHPEYHANGHPFREWFMRQCEKICNSKL